MNSSSQDSYHYHPVRFYLIVYFLTWFFWGLGLLYDQTGLVDLFMLLGLLMPSLVAVITILTSHHQGLIKDFKEKLLGLYRLDLKAIVIAVVMFGIVVVISILVSTLFNQSLDQLSWTKDFSFSVGHTSGLITILLASLIEELGWRGYGEDAVGNYMPWFHESIIFGVIWAFWHLPLFFLKGSYHYYLMQLGPLYVINFMLSGIPLDFFQTFVYVKSNRCMLATIIFHLFVNIMQEKIAMTPQTKVIETFVLIIAAGIIVYFNRKLFFDREHIHHMLERNSL